MNKLFLIALLVVLNSCGKKPNEINDSISSDHSAYIDEAFIQEFHEGFLVSNEETGANDVRAIQPDNNDNIWIATKSGVYRKKPDSREWIIMIAGSDQGPAYDVELDNNGKVWIATWDGVYSNKSGKLENIEGLKGPIAKIVCAKEGVYAIGPYGIWLFKNYTWEKKNYTTGRSMRAALSDDNGGLWIGTDVGLYYCKDEKTTVYRGNDDLISAYVKGLDFSDTGELWVEVRVELPLEIKLKKLVKNYQKTVLQTQI